MPDTATPSLKKRNRLSDIVKLVIFLGIGFFFIYWFLLKLDPSQKEAIWTSFTHADYFWVGVTMVCSCSAILCGLCGGSCSSDRWAAVPAWATRLGRLWWPTWPTWPFRDWAR